MEIGPLVPEKKIFEGFLPYIGVATILVMRPALCHQIFISLYLKAFIQNLVQNGIVVSEKIRFEFLYVHDLGSMSRNDLDLQYSHTFINSNRCLLLPVSGHWLQLFLKNQLFSNFSHRKAEVTKFDLAVK